MKMKTAISRLQEFTLPVTHLWLCNLTDARSYQSGQQGNRESETYNRSLLNRLRKVNPINCTLKCKQLIERALDPKTQVDSFDAILRIGPAAVPSIIQLMDDRRRLPIQQMSVETRAPDAFEGIGTLRPKSYSRCAFNFAGRKLSDESFGEIYNGSRSNSVRESSTRGAFICITKLQPNKKRSKARQLIFLLNIFQTNDLCLIEGYIMANSNSHENSNFRTSLFYRRFALMLACSRLDLDGTTGEVSRQPVKPNFYFAKKYRFSLYLPQTPQTQKKALPPQIGGGSTDIYYTPPTPVSYSIVPIVLPGKLSNVPQKQYFDSVQSGILQPSRGKALGSRDVKVNGVTARDFLWSFSTPTPESKTPVKFSGETRIYKIGRRTFQFTALVKSADFAKNKAQIAKVLGSIRIK